MDFFDIAALSLSSPTASATAVKVQTAESQTKRSRLRDDRSCIGARIIAQVSADLSDDPTGAAGATSAHLSAEPISKAAVTIAGDSCAIWDFSTPEVEAARLAAFVASEMKTHDLGPRDFVLLVRQKAADYAAVLEPAFSAAGIPLRNEAGAVGAVMLQELLAEEVSELAVVILRVAMTKRAGRYWTEC